jgi:hypothetical protein
LVHDRAPKGFARLEDVVDPKEIENVIQRYKSTAGHKISTAAAVRNGER